MSPEDLARAVEPERFRPFTIRISNGDEYKITHPEQVIVSRRSVAIGTRRRNGLRLFEKLDTISLLHVVSLVPIADVEV